MTDKTELEVTTTDDGKEYVIRKGGYFYRPKAEGYTSNANKAGRFSLEQAILYSFPNGPDGDYGLVSIGDEHKALWQQARAAITKATGHG